MVSQVRSPARVGPVEVICGANTQVLELGDGECLTVGEVRTRLSDVVNIPPKAIAVIGDSTVQESRVLIPGEKLQFIKPAGELG